MKNRLAVAFVLFALWVAGGFLPLAAMAVGEALDVPVGPMLRQHPGILSVILGVWLWVFSGISLAFRDEFGMWSAKFRQRLAEMFPWWKKMAGLPEEKVQYYLSLEFSRKMVVVGAWITIAVGTAFVIMGLVRGS